MVSAAFLLVPAGIGRRGGRLFAQEGLPGAESRPAMLRRELRKHIEKMDKLAEKLAALKNSAITNIEANQVWVADTGGGGHGDPRSRDPQAVLNDVCDGFVSVEAAQSIYAVVLVVADEGYSLDEAATKALRAAN